MEAIGGEASGAVGDAGDTGAEVGTNEGGENDDGGGTMGVEGSPTSATLHLS